MLFVDVQWVLHFSAIYSNCFSIWIYFQVMPALELAEREVRKRQLIPDNLSIKWFPYDDKCDPSYATISAMDGYGIDCGHVLFGPTCDYALGKYWQRI